ncbi:hypothetical protein M758_4G186200 [Ceratodon purpureus]|nr:hypothetical protein M758_4G186200 [Ceratodon purpureus]
MIALNRTWQLSDNGLYNALWVLQFLPLQASPESIYTFSIIWRNETTEIPVPSSPMIVPTIPGPPSPTNMKVTGSGTTVGNVGTLENIMITMFDALNNPITEIQDITDANITVTITFERSMNQTEANCNISSNPPGVVCRYMVTVPGWYILNIYSNENQLKTLEVQIGHGALNAANCIAIGDGVGTTSIPLYPGLSTSFTIQTFDHYNNSIVENKAYFEVHGENKNQSGIIIPKLGYPIHIADNLYEIQYTPLKAGIYDLYVARASVHILGSPFQVEVQVGPVDIHCTLDEASLDPCPVSGIKNITLLSKDLFGNIRHSEQDVFHIYKIVDGFPSESAYDIMTPIGNGQYSYGFSCLNDTLIQITYDAMLVYQGKITTNVGPADASQCTMSLETAILRAGEIGKGTVISRDIGGHQLTNGGLVFKIQYWTMSGNNDSMIIIDNADGTYGLTYQIMTSGIYFVIGQYNGITFYSETLLVLPSAPSAPQTIVNLDLNGYTLNVESSFTIQIFDEHQNNITDSGALDTTALSLFYVSSDLPARTALQPAANLLIDFDHESLIYTINFVPILPGIVYINFKVGGEGVLNYGSPYQAIVTPLPPSPSNFDVWGPGIESGAITSETTFFYIRIRDAKGAVIQASPLDNFDVRISPASLVPSGASFVYVGNSIMLFSYMAIQPSTKLTIALTYGGTRIQNPMNLQVKDFAGSIDITQTTILGPDSVQISTSVPLVYTVGDPNTSLLFTIQPRDSNGFIITNPNFNDTIPVFTVMVTGMAIQTIQSDPNEWNFQFSIPYQTSTITMFVAVQANIHGPPTDVKNSGFTILWMPGPSYPANTAIVQSSLNLGIAPCQVVAGQKVKNKVQAFDEYNNPQVYNSMLLDVFTATLNSYPSGDIMDNPAIGLNNGDLTYDLIQTVNLVGLYNITIYLNGLPATVLPLTVVDAGLDLTTLELLTSLADPLVVGQESSFDIMAVDKFQNPITDAQNIYVVLKSLAFGANYTAIVTASNDTMGQFKAMIIPCKAGHFDIIVGDGSARSAGPGVTLATVIVLPGHVNLNLTNTSIPIEVYKAGSPASFQIIALDSYSNPNYMLPQIIISQYDAPAYATSIVSPCNSATLMTGDDLFTCDPDNPLYTAKVMFMPMTLGFLNISIFWDPENLITYENVEVLPGTRPIALSATLSRNLGSIAVAFDTPTDAGYATFGGMHGPHLGWQRCNSTLDQSVMDKIGQGPNCNFIDAQTMVIQLGYNATIMPADSGIGDNVTLLGNIYNQDDTSPSMFGWVPLGITSFTPPPVAQLIGPIITGVCDNITLDASGSSGAAGRALQYNYYVRGTGDPNKLAAIASYLDSIPSQMLVNINGGILDPDQTYIFEVIVTNYMGMSDSATLTIRTVRTSVPQLSIRDNQKLIEIMRWETLELEAHARLSYGFTLQPDGVCALGPKNKRRLGRLPPPAPLMFEWSQTGLITLNPDTTGWTARSLNIPGNLLKPDVVYAFQVKCWPAGSPQLSSTASVAVRATQSPLTVVIVGGSRTANVSENLYIKASVYDPDDSVDANIEELHPYEYNWSCDQLDLNTMYEAIIYPDTAGSIKRTLMIPSKYLQDGSSYVFTLTVARAPYTDKSRSAASVNATITTLSTAMSIIARITNQPEVIAYGMSTSRLLRVTCSAGLGVYKWSVQSGADPRMKAEMGVEMIDEYTMKVKPGTLVPGAVYNFTCIATNLQGTSGVASVFVKTLADPSGGTVELSSFPANQHIAGSTRYTIRAYGWTPGGDMIGPLKYEFRYLILNVKGEVTKEVIIRPISNVNKVTDVFVSPGMVVFQVYVINPGPVRFMPNDGPYGTLFEFEPIQVKKGQIQLLSAPSLLSNYYDFAKRGMYFKSLVSMDAYVSQAFPKLGSGCGSGGNKKAIKDMMNTISFNNPQYPIASQGSAIQSGSGPSIALLTASVYSRIISRPGNLNFDEFKMALHTYMEKLDKVAQYGIKVPTTIATPILTFLDTGDMFVKAVKMKCFKTGTQAQALMDQTSWIPILLAEMIYHNNAFESPTVVDRSMFTVGALGFKLPQNPYNPLGGPMYLSGQMGSFFATVTIDNGFGAEFGITAACFNRWSPLSSNSQDSLNRDKKLIKLLQVCDFSIVGLTISDLFTVTITASFTNLKKIGKGYAYKVVQLDRDGTANFDILSNVVPTVTGVSFDFVTTYSRICLIKMKMDKNYSPVGWGGLYEKFKPPKNKFKLAVKLEKDDIKSTTNYFGSNQLDHTFINYGKKIGVPSFSGCTQLAGRFDYSSSFALFMLLVVVLWDWC